MDQRRDWFCGDARSPPKDPAVCRGEACRALAAGGEVRRLPRPEHAVVAQMDF